ncbi:glycosyl transferase [Arenicella chitinivorans]|uniref:Glycosyl transferase n=2 Tax=Arenicella chitinivorans TaxID=1329800 RepID=A0A918VIE2_9GAMM|nr:glycosyl transferase [Arenicella chitinivorans]
MVSALRRAGINAEIATTNDDGPRKLGVNINALTEYQGVPVRYFNRISFPITALREYSYAPGFGHWLKHHIHDYDIIHVHAIFSYCSTRAMQLARKNRVPYVVRPIGQLERWSLQQSKGRKQWYLDWIERKNITNAGFVQFTAAAEMQQAQEVIHAMKSEVIPLGLEMPMEVRGAREKLVARLKLKRECPIVLFLSRLHRKKGLEILFESVAKIPDLNVQLIVAGDGEPDYVQHLKNLSTSLKINNNCHFVGFAKGAEKALLLQGADLFALTSFSENFGIAALEALAAGTPTLLSTEVALSRTVAEHDVGYVTELDVDDIARTLAHAVTDLEALQEMGNAARDYVEQHFQWSHVVQQLIRNYTAIRDSSPVR